MVSIYYQTSASRIEGPMKNPEADEIPAQALAGNSAPDRAASGTETTTKTTWEVEQKYVVQDARLLSDRLAACGFKRLRIEQHEDLYFQHPCRDFRQTDEAFRLRRQDDWTVITYKGKRLQAAVKTRPEIELDIDAKQFSEWTQMLVYLGFQAVGRVRKQRAIYVAEVEQRSPQQQLVVSFDEVEGLGSFAELELLVDDPQALAEARARIEALAAELRLSQVQPLSYLGQVLAKKSNG